MKKNGFTLIELIVTIAIMALIGLVIGTNMLGILSREEDREYEDFKKRIEEAACMYVEIANEEEDKFDRSDCRDCNDCAVTIDKLIKKGLIAEDLKDPSTGNAVNKNNTVQVTWSNNEKQCKYE